MKRGLGIFLLAVLTVGAAAFAWMCLGAMQGREAPAFVESLALVQTPSPIPTQGPNPNPTPVATPTPF